MRDLVKKYEVYLQSIGKRKNTVSAYITDVSMYLDFLDDNNMEISEEGKPLMSYIQNLSDKKKSPSSIQRTIISLRNFYNFLVAEGNLKRVPETTIKKKKSGKKETCCVKCRRGQ